MSKPDSHSPSDLKDPLRVAFFPLGSENPYQESLAAAMAPLGVEVNGTPPTTRMLKRNGALIQSSDLLHFHWLDQYLLAPSLLKTLAKSVAFLAQIFWLRLRGKPIVWTVHNLISHDATRPRLQEWLIGLFAGNTQLAIAHSQAAARLAQQSYGIPDEKMRVIPHAHYAADYPDPPDPQTARQRLGIDQNAIVVLFIGHVRPYKGIEELAASLRQRPEANLRLVITGLPQGDQIDATLRQAAEQDNRIDYRPGFVADEQVPVYLAACDIVALPYRRILTSGTLLLAASFKKPVIVPDIDSITESIAPDGAIVYDPEQEPRDSLKGAISEAIRRRAELTEMGLRNYQRVISWGWPEMGAATASVYHEALSKSVAQRRCES